MPDEPTADKPVEQKMQSVPFDQEEWDAYWSEVADDVNTGCELAAELGHTIDLKCGDPPLLNPNGSLMLDENGNEMYAKGQSGPPEDPDE